MLIYFQTVKLTGLKDGNNGSYLNLGDDFILGIKKTEIIPEIIELYILYFTFYFTATTDSLEMIPS